MLNENIILQPGNYRIVYRSRTAKETIYTLERRFKIEPGGQVTIKLY